MACRGPQDPNRPLNARRRKRMQAKFLRMGRRHCEWCEDLPHRRESPHCPVCLREPGVEKIASGAVTMMTATMLGQVMG